MGERSMTLTAAIKIIKIMVCAMIFSSCSLLDEHPYSGDIDGEIGLTDKNVKAIEAQNKGKNEITLAFLSDTQGWFDDTRDAVKHINKNSDIDFILHGGDLTDFGLPSEFCLMRDVLQRFSMPWVTAVGNHDLLANGETIYRKIFGETNYAFTAGKVRVIVINSNALEYDFKGVPDFDFLAQEKAYIAQINANGDAIKQTVILMHSHPGDEQFNNAELDRFHEFLTSVPHPVLLSGHTHSFAQSNPFGDDIPLYTTPAIKKRMYLIFTFKDNGYEMQKVEY